MPEKLKTRGMLDANFELKPCHIIYIIYISFSGQKYTVVIIIMICNTHIKL